MNDPQADSLAFRTALLRSERRRIYGVTAFLLVFAAAIAIRILVYGSQMSRSGLLALLLVAAYELWTLSQVTKALKTESRIPSVMWLFNIPLEIVVFAIDGLFDEHGVVRFERLDEHLGQGRAYLAMEIDADVDVGPRGAAQIGEAFGGRRVPALT